MEIDSSISMSLYREVSYKVEERNEFQFSYCYCRVFEPTFLGIYFVCEAFESLHCIEKCDVLYLVNLEALSIVGVLLNSQDSPIWKYFYNFFQDF